MFLSLVFRAVLGMRVILMIVWDMGYWVGLIAISYYVKIMYA